MLTYQEFYASVALPSWAPPAWVFGVAWGIIYPLFAIATVYVLYLTVKRRLPVGIVIVLALNWAANLLFTPIQLGLRPLWPASIDILVVLGTLAYVQWRAWRWSRIIFWLLVPYLLWGLFATVLQLTITLPINPMNYSINIISETQKNTNFRTVLFTGQRSQLVVMPIPPGGQIGQETHQHVEQTLFFLSGTGEAVINGAHSPIGPGSVVVVTPGTQHNFLNTGSEPLKVYTVYAPPNHIDGRVHVTKADADADLEDEAFGEAVR